jgi:hypothetical protein
MLERTHHSKNLNTKKQILHLKINKVYKIKMESLIVKQYLNSLLMTVTQNINKLLRSH